MRQSRQTKVVPIESKQNELALEQCTFCKTEDNLVEPYPDSLNALICELMILCILIGVVNEQNKPQLLLL